MNKTDIVIIAIIFFSILIIKMIYDEISYRKRIRLRLTREWGKLSREEYLPEKLEAIAAYYYAHPGEHDVDDITWNDLEMDKIYQQINHTQSAMGQEYLYYLLRKPELEGEALEERERLITFFMEHEQERLLLQTKLAKMGKMGKFSVYEYLNKIRNLKKENSMVHILQMLALFVSVGLCFVWPSQVVLVAIAIAVTNMVTYYQRKAEMEKYYQLFSYIIRTVHFAKEISKVSIPEIEEYCNSLLNNAKKFDKFCHGSGLVVGGANMTGDIMDTLMDYVRLLTHIDIIKFQSMSREAVRLEKELMAMYEVTGFLDSMISIASYRVMMGEYCVPELVCAEGGAWQNAKEHDIKEQNTEEQYVKEQSEKDNSALQLCVENVYHPLIAEPVKNSISTRQSVLLTGSNASGKSTFIKTIAINAILAQTIHTALADRYCANYFRIYSSMALRDDIMSSESYYIVEIKSLKRILDQSEKEGAPVLCFIDEVLRGTNTVERIASSSQILKMLTESHTMCFAATHDIELTNMLETMYDNYHFEEKVEGNDVIFDYQLREGKAMTRNAIKLLGMIGYREDIIQKAEESVQHFLESGEWRLGSL